MRPQAANPSSQAQPAGQPRAQPSSTPGSLLHMLQQTARLTAAVAAAAALGLAAAPPPAAAVLSNPSMLLPRTAEVALRRAIPAFNLDVRNMQSELEQIRSKLRIPARKPWGSMRGDAAAAAALAEDQQALLAGVPPGDEAAAAELVEQIQRQLARLLAAIDVKDATRTSVRLANSLELVARLELLQAPGLPYQLPRQVAGRPILTGGWVGRWVGVCRAGLLVLCWYQAGAARAGRHHPGSSVHAPVTLLQHWRVALNGFARRLRPPPAKQRPAAPRP